MLKLMDLPQRCAKCSVRHQAICGALSREELIALNDTARTRRFPAGSQLQADEEEPILFANVISGVIKLTKLLPDGRQQIVGLHFPSDFIGRLFSARSPWAAECATEVTLCTYPRRPLEALLRTYPALEHRLFERTLLELDASQDWMVLLGRKTARERVATLLHFMAQRSRSIGCDAAVARSAAFQLPLSRGEVADVTGLTIETVSRQLTGLKKSGVIFLEGARGMRIPDLERLGAIAAGRT